VEDGELNIEFIHAVENTLVNAIEVRSTATTLLIQEIPNQTDNIGSNIDLAVLATGGSSNNLYTINGAPEGVVIDPTTGQISGVVADTAFNGGPAANGVYSVTVTVSQEGLDDVSTEFVWVITETTLTWIDLDEDESYVARHENSFVQAGNEFIVFGGRESAEELDVYDFTNNTWRKGTNTPIEEGVQLEFNHFQAITYEGLVWVIAAFKDNNFPNEVPAEVLAL